MASSERKKNEIAQDDLDSKLAIACSSSTPDRELVISLIREGAASYGAAAAESAPSPLEVRHIFLRDWARHLFGQRRLEGGRRKFGARGVRSSRRHKRKTQRKRKVSNNRKN